MPASRRIITDTEWQPRGQGHANPLLKPVCRLDVLSIPWTKCHRHDQVRSRAFEAFELFRQRWLSACNQIGNGVNDVTELHRAPMRIQSYQIDPRSELLSDGVPYWDLLSLDPPMVVW